MLITIYLGLIEGTPSADANLVRPYEELTTKENLISTRRKKPRKVFQIRRMVENDKSDYFKSLKVSKNYLGHYLNWGCIATEYEMEEFEPIFRHMLSPESQYVDYAICYLGKMVGQISFGPASTDKGLQITYWINKEMSGRGFVTRAVERLIEIAFTHRGLSYLEIQVDQANVASAAIAKKLGFKLYDSYPHDEQGSLGSGIMDVYILLSPKEKLRETFAMLSNHPYQRLDVRPSTWQRKQIPQEVFLHQPQCLMV